MDGAPLGPARRALVLLLWLAALGACALVIVRTPFNADLSAFLPASPDARQRVLIEQVQNGITSRTLLIGIEGGADAAQRAQVSRALAASLRASGLFEQVQNGDNADWAEAGEWIFAHRYQLSPDVTPERFTAQGLRAAIEDTLSLLGTPAGNAIQPLLERDPSGETQRIVEELIPASAPRSEQGVWVSRTEPRALLIASTHAAGSDLDAQAVAIGQVHAGFDAATRGMDAQTPRLLVSGAPLFAVESRDQIKAEAIHLAAVGAVVMGGLLLLAFASPRALVLAFLPVATGVAAGTAAVALVFGAVHGLTMAFGSTLIGETVDYAIYYLIQARGAGWRRWRRENWPTVRIGLLTSVCGFAALVFSGFPGLAQLGVFSLSGLVAAAVATRFVLPVLAPDGAAGMGMRRRLAQVSSMIVRALPHARVGFLACVVTAAVVLTAQGQDLWRADLFAMSPVPPTAQQLDAQLRADLGASDARTLVVVQGTDLEATLRAAEAASTRLETLVADGELAGFETVTRLLPSIEMQRARLASLPPAALLGRRLAEATQGLPLSATRLAPFLAEVEAARAGAPVTRDDLQRGALAGVVNSLLFERPGGGWSTVIALHPGPHFDGERLHAALVPINEAQVVDVRAELDHLYQRYLREAFVQVLLGALAVVVMLFFYLRSWRRLFAVCEPLAFAVLLTMGFFALAGTALGILHLVGLLLVVAVGSNYALYFDHLRECGHADQDTLASLLLANLTTAISFGLIAVSDIPALSAIGRVVAPGALLALLLSAAFTVRRP